MLYSDDVFYQLLFHMIYRLFKFSSKVMGKQISLLLICSLLVIATIVCNFENQIIIYGAFCVHSYNRPKFDGFRALTLSMCQRFFNRISYWTAGWPFRCFDFAVFNEVLNEV